MKTDVHLWFCLARVSFGREMFQTQFSLFMGFLDPVRSDTSRLVGLLWTSDQPEAETST